MKNQSTVETETPTAFFEIQQNNSGGSFDAPAVHVIIEAPDEETARKRTEPHFTLCDAGYAEYDSCGCCPCCGHRWLWPCPEEPTKLVADIRQNGLTFMGAVATALIKADGSIVIGDTPERLESICGYITRPARDVRRRPRLKPHTA